MSNRVRKGTIGDREGAGLDKDGPAQASATRRTAAMVASSIDEPPPEPEDVPPPDPPPEPEDMPSPLLPMMLALLLPPLLLLTYKHLQLTPIMHSLQRNYQWKSRYNKPAIIIII